MGLGPQIKELARFIHVTPDTIINWELRNVKPTPADGILEKYKNPSKSDMKK